MSSQIINSNANTNTPVPTPSTFSLHITSNNEDVNMSLTIPKQVLYLHQYRIEMTNEVSALANPYIYLEVPWLSSNQLIDNNTSFNLIPILLSENTITIQGGLDMPIYLGYDIHDRFNVKIRDATGALLTNFVKASFIFKCEFGHLTN